MHGMKDSILQLLFPDLSQHLGIYIFAYGANSSFCKGYQTPTFYKAPENALSEKYQISFAMDFCQKLHYRVCWVKFVAGVLRIE